MNRKSFFVHRPVIIAVVCLVILVTGIFSLTKLPASSIPKIMRPIVTVTTTYENTGQLEIEELISRPIESALSSLHGIDQITSTSTEGRSDIRVTFQWGADKEDAVNDISGHIDSVLGALPKGVNRPLLIAEVERSDPPAQSFETVLIKIISSIPIIGERIYRYN